jgi:hypothetical protein
VTTAAGAGASASPAGSWAGIDGPLRAGIGLARDLGLDADVAPAYAGKISSDVREAIRRRPQVFAELIRELTGMPDHAGLRLVREVRDGASPGAFPFAVKVGAQVRHGGRRPAGMAHAPDR